MKTADWGLIEYKHAWQQQQALFDQVSRGEEPSTLVLCQHPHVYTLGKSGHAENLLINPDFLTQIGATYFKTDRGGDITYHGPGQLVGYPILNLAELQLGLREYIHHIEQTVINTIAAFGINGARLEGATGVWINGNRKICALGVRASRNTTMHGFALNVTTDLNYFNHINPCGFTDKGVTSIAKEIGYTDDAIPLMDRVKQEYTHQFAKLFATQR